MRERRRVRRDRADLAHDAVGDAACGPAGHDIGNDGGIIVGLGQRRARRCNYLRFRATQIGTADLHAGGAERKRRRDAAPVGDSAGGDYRHPHRVNHLRHQRKRAGLLGDIVGQEHAAVAARLRALRDDDVGAILLQPDRFLHDGRRRHHDAAGRLDPLDQRRIRQAEMEADHFRLQLFDDSAHRLIERRAVGGVDRRCRIDIQFLVVGAKPRLPPRLARGIGIDRRMAEEVHVDGCRDALADDVDLLARLLGREHRAGQRAQRPALRRRDHQFGVHDAGHRRQHDRKFGLEEVDDPAIWPHGSARLNELKGRKDQAAKEFRRPLNIWSASVTILSTISAAGGISWISPADSPAKTAATSKLPAAFAAA